MKKWINSSILFFSLVFLAALFAGEAECRMSAQRQVEMPLDGVKSICIDTNVGRLDIKAIEGIKVIRASGTASAPSKEQLAKIRLTVSREKDMAVIRVESPGMVPKARVYVPEPTIEAGRGKLKKDQLPEEPDAFLHLSVEVPGKIPLVVNTVWGDVTVNGTSSLTLTVNRGNIMVTDLSGDLRLSVDTGEIHIARVAGDVFVTKGDGEIVINTIGGGLTIERNPFGEMRIINVKKTVRIVSDGIGDIMVKQVGGDLIVEDDAGGGIQQESIQGKIQIPRAGPPKHVREKNKTRKGESR